MTLKISIKKIAIWLTSVVLALNSISFVSKTIEYIFGYEETPIFVRLFHVAREGNISSWFSSLLLLFSAILLALIALAKKEQKVPYLRHWSIMSIIFFYLSLDEAASIHELSGKLVRSILNVSGIFHNTFGPHFYCFLSKIPARSSTGYSTIISNCRGNFHYWSIGLGDVGRLCMLCPGRELANH